MTEPNISAEWYRQHAARYAQIAADPDWYTFLTHSHPKLTDELAVFDRLVELVPGKRGLDLGCGAGARDVFRMSSAGYDVQGLDAIEENIAVAKQLHPDLADKLSVHDLRRPLLFADASFDFAYCDSVFQHLEPAEVHGILLPEAVRVLKVDGVLQLLFKSGRGFKTIRDPGYDEERSFRLYDPNEVVERLQLLGMSLVEPEKLGAIGGIQHCTDPRQIDICIMWARKGSPAGVH